MAIMVGHPAYGGINAPWRHDSYKDALRDLLERRVPMRAAHKALQAALSGSFSIVEAKRGIVEVSIVK